MSNEEKSHERGHVKLVRAASSHYATKMQSTQTKDNKSINAHKPLCSTRATIYA